LSRWIVDTLPAWLVLLGLVVVIAGGAVAVQKVLRRRYPGSQETRTTMPPGSHSAW
jgi:hypothetical protein